MKNPNKKSKGDKDSQSSTKNSKTNYDPKSFPFPFGETPPEKPSQKPLPDIQSPKNK